MKSPLSWLRSRRDAELARRTDQAARTKGHVESEGDEARAMRAYARRNEWDREIEEQRHQRDEATRTQWEPDREYVSRLWAEDWDSAEDRTADDLNPPHACAPFYACYDHQERRS